MTSADEWPALPSAFTNVAVRSAISGDARQQVVLQRDEVLLAEVEVQRLDEVGQLVRLEAGERAASPDQSCDRRDRRPPRGAGRSKALPILRPDPPIPT